MAIESIYFYSEEQACALVPTAGHAMISITEPGRLANLARGWGRLLRIQFIDGTYDEEMIRANWNMRRLHFNGCVRQSHVTAIHTFLDEADHDHTITSLLVHCQAGQSRSAAIARYAAERYGVNLAQDSSRYNQTVYELLHDPDKYEYLLAEPKPQARRMNFLKLLGIR